MKNSVLYFLLAVTMVASCRRDDDHIFDKSPDDRLNDALKAYQATLTSSTYGWNASLVTGNGGNYRFYFVFNDSNRVQMYGDWDSTTASALKESSYRLKALQQPSLIFDTYSYLHILADPDRDVNGGAAGVGLKSDFEFRIDTVMTDSINLTGRFNGSILKLKKATQQDRAVWDSKQVANGIVNFRNYWKFLLYFKRITYSGTQYELQFDTTLKKVTVSWITGNQTQSVTRGYYFWSNGIYFNDPIVNGTITIPGFSIGAFNAGAQILNVAVNGSAATIKGDSIPVNPDIRNAAPRRWYNFGAASDYYWISENGFHKNGVDDAFNIKSLKTDTSTYAFLLYRPNTGSVDAFIPLFLKNSPQQLFATYGSWLIMNANQNTGVTSFTEYDDRTIPWPTSGPAADTRAQMLIPTGYYFVQTSPYSYDMVSVADAKTWLTWIWVF